MPVEQLPGAGISQLPSAQEEELLELPIEGLKEENSFLFSVELQLGQETCSSLLIDLCKKSCLVPQLSHLYS